MRYLMMLTLCVLLVWSLPSYVSAEDLPPKQDDLTRKPGKNPNIYALGRQGAKFLGLPSKNNNVEKEKIDHDVMAGKIYAVIYSACREYGITIKARDIEPNGLPILNVHGAGRQYRTIPDLLFEIDDILYIEAETGKNVAWRKSDFESSSYYKKLLYYQELYVRVL